METSNLEKKQGCHAWLELHIIAGDWRFESSSETMKQEDIDCLAGPALGPDSKKAERRIRKAADQGHSGAQFNLGAMYLRGEAVGEDDEGAEVVMWFRKAAAQGHAAAQRALDNTPRQFGGFR